MTDKPLIVICAWCVGSREKTAAAIAAGQLVSHGLCKVCEQKMLEDEAA